MCIFNQKKTSVLYRGYKGGTFLTVRVINHWSNLPPFRVSVSQSLYLNIIYFSETRTVIQLAIIGLTARVTE